MDSLCFFLLLPQAFQSFPTHGEQAQQVGASIRIVQAQYFATQLCTLFGNQCCLRRIRRVERSQTFGSGQQGLHATNVVVEVGSCLIAGEQIFQQILRRRELRLVRATVHRVCAFARCALHGRRDLRLKDVGDGFCRKHDGSGRRRFSGILLPRGRRSIERRRLCGFRLRLRCGLCRPDLICGSRRWRLSLRREGDGQNRLCGFGRGAGWLPEHGQQHVQHKAGRYGEGNRCSAVHALPASLALARHEITIPPARASRQPPVFGRPMASVTYNAHVERLYTAAESREVDRRAIEDCGVAGFDLMCRAARFACDVFTAQWPDAASACVVAGRGNNAGDGYVLAALLRTVGVRVTLLQAGPAPDRGDGALAVAYARERGVRAEPFVGAVAGDVVVDALLGTGVSGALRAPYLEAVRAINRASCPVLAIDLPTGLSADTGGAVGEAADVVRADVTATFITRKIGQHTGLGLEACGLLRYHDLHTPEEAYQGGVPWLRDAQAPQPLAVNSYKHARGHVVVVGGDTPMGGAVILAGEAALRSGAGMVTLATRPGHRPPALARRPELMVVDADDRAALETLLGRASAVVLGPGLGRAMWGRGLFDFVIGQAPRRLLVDADGLFHLAETRQQGAAVITPHVAEAARLLDMPAGEVQADRPRAARLLSERYGACAVLKGAGSVIAEAAALAVCGRGTPAMATAGMGDVLCGVLAAALNADDRAVFDAVCRAVVNHAIAGELAERRLGRHIVASDLFAELARL